MFGKGVQVLEIYLPSDAKPEHRELHERLSKARRLGGRTAQAAQSLMEVLFPHILLEEKYAAPPLSLLSRLAGGEVTEDMSHVIRRSEKLKSELPKMLEDHRRIVAALASLMQAAAEEKHEGYAEFGQKLIRHAQQEEEYLYPAAILVGEYVKLKLGRA
jgi:hypothetical protein